jgi:hypothetical protein
MRWRCAAAAVLAVPVVLREAEQMGRHAATASETHPAIRHALDRVDNHSFLIDSYDPALLAAPGYGFAALYPDQIVYMVSRGSPASASVSDAQGAAPRAW